MGLSYHIFDFFLIQNWVLVWIDLLAIQTKCVSFLFLSFRRTAQAAFMLLYNIRGVMAEWLERLGYGAEGRCKL